MNSVEKKIAQDNALDRKIEKHFRSHRDTPSGKNFACWDHDETPETITNYRQGFDSIFPDAPGAGI